MASQKLMKMGKNTDCSSCNTSQLSQSNHSNQLDEVVLQGAPHTVELQRPRTSHHIRKDDMLEEILSIKFKLFRGKASAFRVFVNLPDANGETPITVPEFAGSYIHESRIVKGPDFELQVMTYRFGISEVIKQLGLGNKSSLLVTFVPYGVDKELPVVLEQIKLELE